MECLESYVVDLVDIQDNLLTEFDAPLNVPLATFKGNKELVIATGLKDFAMPGLYSIVLEQNGVFKTRLFIYDYDERTIGKQVVPIHMHKYIDQFNFLFGSVTDYCYKLDEHNGVISPQYSYSRLSDEKQSGLKLTGETGLLKLDNVFTNRSHIIQGNQYHTVSIHKPYTAWIIKELSLNELYESNKCYLLPSMSPQETPTTKMTEADFRRVEQILRQNKFSLGIF
jgi:hypothetical protein